MVKTPVGSKVKVHGVSRISENDLGSIDVYQNSVSEGYLVTGKSGGIRVIRVPKRG